jgi:exodeoxyribonuclease VII small subunit
MGKETKLQQMTFEEALAKLEEIVDQLESGDVPLEKAIESFQQGMQLSKLCHQKLELVERKIEQLVQEGDDWVKKPMVWEGEED